MKILHVGDMAGSAAITSNICSKIGHPSTVIQDKNVETFEHGVYYDNTTYFNDHDEMLLAIKAAEEIGYDHIVYHDMFKLAVESDDLHLQSSYMFHGNMLRQNPEIYKKIQSLESIENIFVTTEDLLVHAPDAELFNRPVDMDLFTSLDIEKKDIGLCLTQDRYKKYVLDIIKGNETGVFVVDRVKNKVTYGNMPQILCNYSYYYDVKFQPTHPPTLIEELSQTGLQALACKIPVWSCGKWYHKFPERHNDENSAREFIRVLSE